MRGISKILLLMFGGVVIGSVTIPLFYEIKPGKAGVIGQNALSGTFTVERTAWLAFSDTAPFVKVAGYRSQKGGACLVARPAHLRLSYAPTGTLQADGSGCSTDTECGTGGFGGYCHPVEKQCWVRPGGGEVGSAEIAPVCNRSVDYKPPKDWKPGIYFANRTPFKTNSIPSEQQVEWRVVACHVIDGTCVNTMGEIVPLPR